MTREIIPVNGSDRDWTSGRYVLWFGAYGDTCLMVWANSLESAFDECVDWIEEHAPGLLADEQVAEAYSEARREGKTDSEAFEVATTDITTGGNAGHAVNSWEWGILAENPTREEVLALQGRAAS